MKGLQNVVILARTLKQKLKSAYSNNMIETGNFENKALCNIYKKFFRRLLNSVTFNQRRT